MSPRLKKLTFKLILLLLVLSMLEGVSCVGLKIVTGGASSEEVERRKAATAGEAVKGEPGAQGRKPNERVIHPFVGYLFRPGMPPTDFTTKKPTRFPTEQCEVNRHGFLSDGPFLPQGPSPNTVRVLITGGSVANNLFCKFRSEIAAALGKLPAYQGKAFKFVALAFEGWRQPQQLQALSFYLAQGGEADLLLAVDGFNEVASQTVGFPYYPEHWRMLVGGTKDARQLGLIGRIEVYRDWRRDLARSMIGVSWPVTLNLSWALADRLLETRGDTANMKLAALVAAAAKTKADFRLDGPQRGQITGRDMPRVGASVWRRSTLVMARLAQQAGIRAYFFLQPSLHMEGAKPLTGEEQALKKQGAPRYKLASDQGYSALEEGVTHLRSQGVKITNLSKVFKESPETLYVDSCCHFNAAGNRLMIQAMVEAMGEGEGAPTDQ